MGKLKNKVTSKGGQDIIKTFSAKKTASATSVAPVMAVHADNAALTYQKAPVYKSTFDYSGSVNQSFTQYSLHHIKNLTTDFGIKQNISDTDLNIYALDDNATALVIMCEHYELTKEKTDLELIDIYLNFIQYCLQPNGYFFKYVDVEKKFTDENNGVNLADTTGCAIWSLGYLISKKKILPAATVEKAEAMFEEALGGIKKIHSINAIAYIIKGLYYRNTRNETIEAVWLIKQYANILVNLYNDVENNNWKWFQSNISLSSSQISEALLCAWLATGEPVYKQIAKTSFDFMLSKVFKEEGVTSFLEEEKMFEGKKSTETNTLIFALNTFHKVYKEDEYLVKIKRAAEWLQWNKFMDL